MGNVSDFFASVPTDWFIFGAIVIVLTLDSLRSGIGRACSLALAAPLAVFIFSLVDSAAFIGDAEALSAPMTRALIFGICLVLSFLAVRRISDQYIDGGMGQLVHALIASGATAVVLFVTWLAVPEFSDVYQFGPAITNVFAEGFRIWWLLGAYASLVFARG